MRKPTLFISTILILVLSLVSCAGNQIEDTASVRFSVDAERSRTIGDLDLAVVTQYRFSFANRNNASITYEKTMDKSAGGTYTMSGIIPGTYNITATALNSSGNEIATTTLNGKVLNKGNNSFTLTFNTLSGNGNMDITLKWNKEVFTNSTGAPITPTITATLKKLDGTTVSGVTATTDQISNGISKITKSGISSGSYILEVTFKVGTTKYFGSRDVVRIVTGATATGEIDFSKSGSLEQTITIVDNTYVPLEGIITANRYYTEGQHASGAVTLTLSITNLPSSYDESKLKIDWFGEDIQIDDEGENPLTITFSPFFGYARYTCVMYIEGLEGSLGSATLVYYYPY